MQTKYPYDLTETGEPDISHYAARDAYDYGVIIGGKGRLMTLSEAKALEAINKDILYGINGKSSSNFLVYWLSTASCSDDVWSVYGLGRNIAEDSLLSDEYGIGVRPVVEIAKSSI